MEDVVADDDDVEYVVAQHADLEDVVINDVDVVWCWSKRLT